MYFQMIRSFQTMKYEGTRAQAIYLTRKYMIAYSPGLAQALQ